jgi:PPOX class probable F420-dependent enzyme
MTPESAISPPYNDLVEAPNTAILSTLMRGGSPDSSPVWFLFDGGQIQASTLADRVKHRNVTRDGRVAFTVLDPNKPLRYLEVRGTVTRSDDPDGVIRDRIAVKHGFADGGPFDPPGARRVRLSLQPARVIEH